MTPKPKVRRDDIYDDLWLWECACGVRGLLSSYWSITLDEAQEHSRTHTAERIADELDRLFDAYQGAAVFSSDHTRSMFYRGKREGTLDAARLIRTHLV